MRILLISQYFLPQPLANAEVIGGLALSLAERGHELTVVSPVPEATSAPGLHHRRALGTFSKDRRSIGGRLLEYGSFSVGALLAGASVPRPDVVVVPSPPLTLGLVGRIVAARHRAPLVYNVQDLYPEVMGAVGSPPGALQRALRLLARWIYRTSAAVVVIDPAFVKPIEASCPTATVRAVRNGLDTTPFRGAVRDEEWLASIGVPSGSRVVMYAGNIGRSQDLEPVVHATSEAGAELVIHGGGAALGDLQSVVGGPGYEHVHLSGYVDRQLLGTVYASADVHVVPLKPGVAWASVPSKLLSIFSAARPAVLAAELDSPAASVVREAGGGWVVEPGDPQALADAVVAALTDRAALQLAGERAAAWAASNAGQDRMAAEWDAVLTEACHRRSR